MTEDSHHGGGKGHHSRQRRPSLIKELEGNRAKLGRDRIKEDPRGIGEPTEPLGLDPKARELWRAVVGSLPIGLLSRADDCMLELFAREWATWREADSMIQKTGLMVQSPNGPIRNPLLPIRNNAVRNITALGAALGLSPVARSRLVAADAAEADPLALLLGDDGDPAGAWNTAPRTRQ